MTDSGRSRSRLHPVCPARLQGLGPPGLPEVSRDPSVPISSPRDLAVHFIAYSERCGGLVEDLERVRKETREAHAALTRLAGAMQGRTLLEWLVGDVRAALATTEYMLTWAPPRRCGRAAVDARHTQFFVWWVGAFRQLCGGGPVSWETLADLVRYYSLSESMTWRVLQIESALNAEGSSGDGSTTLADALRKRFARATDANRRKSTR